MTARKNRVQQGKPLIRGRLFKHLNLVLLFYFLLFATSSTAHLMGDGITQVNKLFVDRPNLSAIVTKNSEVWNWLVVRFSPDIHWSPVPPDIPYTYNSSFSYNSDGTVDLHVDYCFRGGERSGEVLPPQKILACVVYELFNVTHKSRFLQLDKMVRDGANISRDDYIMEMSRQEHMSLMSLQDFYVYTWLPYAVDNHIDPCPQYWHRGTFADFGMWFRSMPRDEYPWDVYGKFYDMWRYQAGK